jgi:hypothetical protein
MIFLKKILNVVDTFIDCICIVESNQELMTDVQKHRLASENELT